MRGGPVLIYTRYERLFQNVVRHPSSEGHHERWNASFPFVLGLSKDSETGPEDLEWALGIVYAVTGIC